VEQVADLDDQIQVAEDELEAATDADEIRDLQDELRMLKKRHAATGRAARQLYRPEYRKSKSDF